MKTINNEYFTKKYTELGGLITESIASELTGKSISTIERWKNSKKIRSIRAGKRTLVSYSDIYTILNK